MGFRQFYVCVGLILAGLVLTVTGRGLSQVRGVLNLGQEVADLTAAGAMPGAGLGESTAAADINQDGFADLVVGAPGSNSEGRSGAGAVYVIYGRSGRPPALVDFSTATIGTSAIVGPEAGAGLGTAVAIGDVNGDGFRDLILGAPSASPGSRQGAGSVFIVYGRTGSLPAKIDLALSNAGVLRLDGESAGDAFGRAVAAGNINGDAFADVIVGAPGSSPNGRSRAGQGYVYSGGPTLENPVRVAGAAAGDGLGGAAGAGDLNRDGLDEVLLGAPESSPVAGPGAGTVYVIAGRLSALPARLDLGTNPAGVSRVMGERARDRLGSSMAVGDFNGDQVGDLAVGARLADPAGGFNAGAVYLILGRSGGTIPDADLNGNPPGVTRVLGERANDLTGQSVAFGDLNKDGFADLIAGAPSSYLTDDRESETPGKVVVVYGRATPSATVDLSANPAGVARITGVSGYIPNTGASDRTGQSVASGDFNGDGFADLVMGASGADPGGRLDGGRVYLISAGPRPDLRVSAGGMVFGNVVVGQSKRLTAAVTNAGTSSLSINTITASNAQFKVLPAGPASLNPGDSLAVTVTFTPTGAGPQSASLTITTSNDPDKGSVTLPLSGTGAQPILDVPPSLSFGRVALGQPAVSTLQISNLGSSDLTVRKISSSDSQFVARPDSLVVPAGGRLRVTVIFTPKALGTASAMMTLLSDDPNRPASVVSLSGSAASPRATVSTSSLTFGSVLLGASFAARLTVSNLGEADLNVTRLVSDNPQFTAFPTAFTVGSGRSQDVTITFTPVVIGSQRGTLTLSTNDPQKPTLAVTVTGDGGRQPAISLSTSQLNFGTVDVGTSRDTSLFVKNRGDGILAVTSVASSDTQFTAKPDSFTISGGDSVRVTVRFSPKDGRDLSAALLVSSNDPAVQQSIVTLSGRGSLRVSGAVSERSLRFGEVEVGTRKTLVLTVYSRGNAPLSVRSIASSDTQFVARPDSLTVAGGDSASVAVTFSPSALRDVSAGLTVVTNDFAQGAIQIPVTGSGTKVMRYSMDLDPTPGDQAATRDTVRLKACTASVSLYLNNALNLSAFNLSLRFSSNQLFFRSFSDVGPGGEDNFLRSAGGNLTLSASQTSVNTLRVTGALANPTLATAPDGGGLLVVLQFDVFSPPEGFVRGDSAVVSVEQAIFTRLADTGPDTLRGAVSARLSFSAISGDCNADGVVDTDDFFILAGTFGMSQGDAGYNPACDLNRDGIVDLIDFFALTDRIGTRAASCRGLLPGATKPGRKT